MAVSVPAKANIKLLAELNLGSRRGYHVFFPTDIFSTFSSDFPNFPKFLDLGLGYFELQKNELRKIFTQ